MNSLPGSGSIFSQCGSRFGSASSTDINNKTMFRADQSSISRLVKMVSSMLKPSSNHRDSKLGSRSVMFTLCGSSFTPSGFLYFSVLFHPVISMIIIHFLGSSKSPPTLAKGGRGVYPPTLAKGGKGGINIPVKFT